MNNFHLEPLLHNKRKGFSCLGENTEITQTLSFNVEIESNGTIFFDVTKCLSFISCNNLYIAFLFWIIYCSVHSSDWCICVCVCFLAHLEHNNHYAITMKYTTEDGRNMCQNLFDFLLTHVKIVIAFFLICSWLCFREFWTMLQNHWFVFSSPIFI